MEPPLNLSRNELRFLLRLASKGFFGADFDYVDLGNHVLRLEMFGQNGVSLFVQALKGMDGQSDHPPKSTREQSGALTLDLQGGSLLIETAHICDIVSEERLETGGAILKFQNAQHPEALIAVVAACRMQGLPAFAAWEGQSVFWKENDLTLHQYTGEGVALYCGSLLPNIEVDAQPIGSSLEAHYQRHLDEGLSIPAEPYHYLKSLVDRVLVKTDEASRRGAGE